MECRRRRRAARQTVGLMFALLIPCCDWPTKPPISDLIEQFKNAPTFWLQFDVAREIVSRRDKTVLPLLAADLNNSDRHRRGNAAFIFSSLGDDRGFQVITDILKDRSDRPPGQCGGVFEGVLPPGNRKTPLGWSLRAQIAEDRYYAAHLLGDLRDPRAVPILVPLLKDLEVNYIVPWSLGEIGDRSAIGPLIETLRDKNPDMRFIAIDALVKLKAKEALPQMQALVDDNERIGFDGQGTVADAASTAIAQLSGSH